MGHHGTGPFAQKGQLFSGLSWVISHVPIEHHPTIGYMVYNGYYKVMSNIPKMGHLPTPAFAQGNLGKTKHHPALSLDSKMINNG